MAPEPLLESTDWTNISTQLVSLQVCEALHIYLRQEYSEEYGRREKLIQGKSYSLLK